MGRPPARASCSATACGSGGFGADPKIVGRKIVIGPEPFDVIGVMPGASTGSSTGGLSSGPLRCSSLDLYDDYHRRRTHLLSAVGRLKPGISPRAGAPRCRRVCRRPQARSSSGLVRRRLDDQDAVARRVRHCRRSGRLRAALGAVGCVLDCVREHREPAARALRPRARARWPSARRSAPRVARSSGSCSPRACSSSLAGAAVGLLIAHGAIRALIALAPMDQLRTDSDPHRWRGAGVYTLGIALATGLLFGFAPALTASRADLQHALKDGAYARASAKAGGSAARSSSRRWRRADAARRRRIAAQELRAAAGREPRVRSIAPGHDDRVAAGCEFTMTSRPGLPSSRPRGTESRPCRVSSRLAPPPTSRLARTGGTSSFLR